MFINNKIVFDICDRNNVYTFKWKPVANQTLAGGCENQCDQMAKFSFNLWPFRNNEKFHRCIKICKTGFKKFPGH